MGTDGATLLARVALPELFLRADETPPLVLSPSVEVSTSEMARFPRREASAVETSAAPEASVPPAESPFASLIPLLTLLVIPL